MPAEATQEKGRAGVALVKRWLEATTHIELPWNAYENPPLCAVRHLNGSKQFDLAGYFLTNERQPVFVESKSYGSDGGQYREFQEFLAIAYSATALGIEERADSKREFLWVTTHPFGPLTRWAGLATEDEILEALKLHGDYLQGGSVEPAIAREVAGRIWVLVLNEKQERISLTAEETWEAVKVLKRKASTL